MFCNVRFHLFYCILTENCKVYHKVYLLLNGDRAVLTRCFNVDERAQTFSTKWQKKNYDTAGANAKEAERISNSVSKKR